MTSDIAVTTEGLCVWKFNPHHDVRGRFSSGVGGPGNLLSKPGATEPFNAGKMWTKGESVLWDTNGRMAFGTGMEEHGDIAKKVWGLKGGSSATAADVHVSSQIKNEFLFRGGVRAAVAMPYGSHVGGGVVEVSQQAFERHLGRILSVMDLAPPGAEMYFEIRRFHPTETIKVRGLDYHRSDKILQGKWVSGTVSPERFLNDISGQFTMKSADIAVTSEGLAVFKFNPHHDSKGRFASGSGVSSAGTAARTKGGYAANGMTVTSVGLLGEKVAQKIGFEQFESRLQTYTRPCDFRVNGTHAVEVKTFSAGSSEKKIRMVGAALKRKVAFAKQMGLKPRTVAVVLSNDLKSAEIYQRDGFGNFRVANMTHVGSVRL